MRHEPEPDRASPAAPAGGRSTLARRIGLIGLVLGLLGVPTFVILAMFTVDLPREATEGEQPGGTVRGTVTDSSGRPLLGLDVVGSTLVRGEERHPVVRTAPSAAGRFELSLPAHRGRYVIEAGGDAWVTRLREVSFLDRRGRTIEPADLEFELEPACVLELEFTSGSNKTPVSGEWSISGSLHRAFLALFSPHYERKGRFEDGALRIGGLPPMNAKLHLDLDDARSITLDLELSAGSRRETLEL